MQDLNAYLLSIKMKGSNADTKRHEAKIYSNKTCTYNEIKSNVGMVPTLVRSRSQKVKEREITFLKPQMSKNQSLMVNAKLKKSLGILLTKSLSKKTKQATQ